MPKEHFFVISDLHLGGKPSLHSKDSSFQICPPEPNQQLLAAFIRWVAKQKTSSEDVHLILAGDIVDFLAEEDETAEFGFRSFTSNDKEATKKLERAVSRSQVVWEALNDLLRAGGALTLMIGNHDVELTLPGPKQFLSSKLAGERVSYYYNNEPLLIHGKNNHARIEHGNEYDRWNRIDYKKLAQIQEAIKQDPKHIPSPLLTPGSELVVRVMNKYKKLAFIDLLKPETSAAIPLLAVLEPKAISSIDALLGLLGLSFFHGLSVTNQRDPRNISAERNLETPTATFWTGEELGEELKLLEFARDLQPTQDNTTKADARNIGARQTARAITDIWKARGNLAKEQRLNEEDIQRILRALRGFTKDEHCFFTNKEVESYLKAANKFAKKGAKYVIFGHTHLAKRVSLDEPGALYLNTGTWAYLLRLPREIYSTDYEKASSAVRTFVEALAENKLENLRELRATFAWIQRDNNKVTADVYKFSEGEQLQKLPDDPRPE
jgi:UDP-2,3-diacylglucosamine pyrophosphatase LpxH